MNNPSKLHWEAVKWILRYLRGTTGKALCFKGGDTILTSYVDADLAGNVDIRRSRDGNGAGLGRAPLSHTRPKIFNYFPSPSQTRNGAGSSFPSLIRIPLKIPYPLRPAPPCCLSPVTIFFPTPFFLFLPSFSPFLPIDKRKKRKLKHL